MKYVLNLYILGQKLDFDIERFNILILGSLDNSYLIIYFRPKKKLIWISEAQDIEV